MHCIGAREGASIVPWWDRVVEVFLSRLVSVIFLAPFLLKMKFFNEKLFSLVSVLFWGF